MISRAVCYHSITMCCVKISVVLLFATTVLQDIPLDCAHSSKLDRAKAPHALTECHVVRSSQALVITYTKSGAKSGAVMSMRAGSQTEPTCAHAPAGTVRG